MLLSYGLGVRRLDLYASHVIILPQRRVQHETFGEADESGIGEVSGLVRKRVLVARQDTDSIL